VLSVDKELACFLENYRFHLLGIDQRDSSDEMASAAIVSILKLLCLPI
jgi:hypothetical protein